MASPSVDACKLSACDVLHISEQIVENHRSLDEKGLYADRDAEARAVIESLTAAFEALKCDDAVAAIQQALEGDRMIHQVLYDRSWWWRFRTRFQPMVVLYNLAILAYLLFAGGWRLNATEVPAWLLLPEEIWQIPVAVLAFGAAGAVLRVFYWLHLKVAKGQNRPRNQLGYFLAPWIGALFGAIVYVVVRAGLWTFQGEATESGEPKLWAVLALAALAGFSWDWIIQWLENVMDRTAKRGGVPAKQAESTAGGATGSSAKPAQLPRPPVETKPGE